MRRLQLFFASLFVLAQAMNAQQWIDGATNPEKIPDSRAYIFLFQALSPRPNELADGYLKRTTAYISSHTTLDEADRAILIQASNEFYLSALELARQRNALPKSAAPASNPDWIRLRKAYEDKALATALAMKSRLSAKGRQALDEHIGYVKSHSRILVKP